MSDDAVKAAAPAPPPPARDWGFPAFAADFPRDDALDALVDAFARGDYGAVRSGTTALLATDATDAVKTAARTLRERTSADPAARLLFLFAGALLVLLTVWWVLHDGPPPAE